MSAPALERPGRLERLEHPSLVHIEAGRRSEMVIESIEALHRDHPDMSARHTTSRGQRVFFLIVLVALGVGLAISWVVTLRVVAALVVLAYVAAVGYRLLCLRRALRDDSAIRVGDAEARTEVPDTGLPVFTIMAPCYREPEVVAQLLSNLAAMDYPHDKLDVVILLEEGDTETAAAAVAAGPEAWVRLVVVPRTELTTKPRALTYGLKLARGSIVTVYDAEDRPETLQLRRAAVAFHRDPDLACVQARLEFFNAGQNLITRWFTAEYLCWFLHFLPGLVSLGAPLPLGGTSNHIRVAALDEVGGWDPYNVTEDADLGLRLERSGHRIGVLDSVTLEEANSDFVNWAKQRSRWYKGYLQTSLVHLRHPLQLRSQIGLSGLAGVLLFVLGTPVLAVLQPVFWILTLVWFIAGPQSIEEVFSGPVFFAAWLSWVLGNTSMLYLGLLSSRQARRSDLVLSQLISPAYWVMMSLAAVKALVQIVRSPSLWEKTVHGLDTRSVDLRDGVAVVARPAPNVVPYTVPEAADRTPGGRVVTTPQERTYRRRSATGWFLGLTALYLVLGAILALHYQSIPGDAQSRTDNAAYVLYSRDPHLAAIGFVWNPLPSLLQIPVLLLSPLYKPLLSLGLASVVISAPMMAGAVVQLRGILVDRNSGWLATAVVPALFALHPMSLYFGANGLSEAYLVFFTVWATRYLIRWVRDENPNALVVAGIALGLGYLARYEAVLTGAGAVLLVAVVTIRRTSGPFPGRLLAALHDCLLVGAPLALAVSTWAALSALIVGTPFEQFSSRYGNSAQLTQIRASVAPSGTSTSAFAYTAQQMDALQPLFLVALSLALVVGLARRRGDSAVAPLLFLPPLVFAAVAFDKGATFGWLRFSILIVPFTAVLIAQSMPAVGAGSPGLQWHRPQRLLGAGGRFVAVLLAAAVMVPAFFTTANAFQDSRLGREEVGQIARVRAVDAAGGRAGHLLDTDQLVAQYLDSLGLPPGSVLTDVAHSFAVWGDSDHRNQFVITPDRTFERAVADPAVFGIRYLLVVPDSGLGAADALNVAYPTVYADGAGLGSLLTEWHSETGGSDFRLYAVTPLSAG